MTNFHRNNVQIMTNKNPSEEKTIFWRTLLRPLYFDHKCTSTCIRPIRSPDFSYKIRKKNWLKIFVEGRRFTILISDGLKMLQSSIIMIYVLVFFSGRFLRRYAASLFLI